MLAHACTDAPTHANTQTHTHTHTHTHTFSRSSITVELLPHSLHDYHPSCVKAPSPKSLTSCCSLLCPFIMKWHPQGLYSFHKLTEINSSLQTKYPSSSHCLSPTWAFIVSDILQRHEPEADTITLLISCLLQSNYTCCHVALFYCVIKLRL